MYFTKNKVCFIHEVKYESRIKNWNHDANKFLDDAIIKFNKGVKLINEKYKIEKKS
ncbi:hypothetical protein ACQQ2T_05170 [Paraclostridium tenue]